MRLSLHAQHVEAEVLEDRGNIGYNGRQLIRLRLRGETDEAGDFEVAADEVELIARAGD